MFNALIEGAAEITKNPFYFIPALFVMVLNTIISLLAVDHVFQLVYSAFVFGEVPEATLVELPYYMLTIYTGEILVIAAATFVAMLLGFYLVFVYASLLSGKEKGGVKALTSGFSRIGELIGLTFFTGIAALLYAAIGYALFVASITFEGIGIITFILFLALILAGIYIYVKLAFTPVIMAVEKRKLKEALADCWKWTAKKPIGVAFFLVVLGFIAALGTEVFSAIGDATGIEEVSLAIFVIGVALVNTYYNIAYIKYYLGSKTGK